MPENKATVSKNHISFNAVSSLDGLLSDIINQISIVEQDEKEVPYLKLIELFFKGIDLRQKIVNPDKLEFSEPKFNVIKGIDHENI